MMKNIVYVIIVNDKPIDKLIILMVMIGMI